MLGKKGSASLVGGGETSGVVSHSVLVTFSWSLFVSEGIAQAVGI